MEKKRRVGSKRRKRTVKPVRPVKSGKKMIKRSRFPKKINSAKGVQRKRQGWDANAYNEAYDSGFDEAYNDGYNIGYKEGSAQGDEEDNKGG